MLECQELPGGQQGSRSQGFFDGSVFEASKKEGDEALKTFLRNGVNNTSVTCVLAGQYTAGRRWVRYEIVRSVLKGNGLLTVDIHGVRNNDKQLGVKGTNLWIRWGCISPTAKFSSRRSRAESG